MQKSLVKTRKMIHLLLAAASLIVLVLVLSPVLSLILNLLFSFLVKD
jgi:hypothetical protein